MRHRPHLGARDAAVVMMVFILSKAYLNFPTTFADRGKSAAWLVVLVATAVAVPVFLLLTVLMRRFPGRTLMQVTEETLGPVLGVAFNLGYFVFFFVLFAVVLREFAETFIIAILPETPPSVLILVLLLVALYAAYQGIEAMARACWLIFPGIHFATGGVLLFVLNLADWNFLFPFWGPGAGAVVVQGASLAPIFAEVLLLLVVYPLFRSHRDMVQAGLWSVVLSGALFTWLAAQVIAIFGAAAAMEQPFPLYELARLVYLGRFFQRVESLLVMFWIFVAVLKVGIILYGCARVLAGTLQLPHHRPLLYPTAVLGFAGAMVPDNFTTVTFLDTSVVRTYGWIPAFILPLVVLLVAVLRGKGERTSAG